MTRALPDQSVAKGAEYERVDKGAPISVDARRWAGWGTALKPAWEPIVMARKPLIGTVAENVLQHGTGALNIDGCRVETAENLNGGAYTEGGARDRLTGDDRVGAAAGMFQAGKTVGAEFVQPEGRWPANIVHDGSDEVLAAFPAERKSGGDVASPPSNKTVGIYGDFSGDRQRFHGHPDSGSAARFFYTAKADADDRLGSKHPTVKPLDLMQYLVRLVTPPGGTVLDPFAGTGTTGEAAWREGLRAVLIEREAASLADIDRRMTLAVSPAKRAAVARSKNTLRGAEGTPLFGDGPHGDSAGGAT